jgi:TetR/AcrR family transcriptional regulator, transcriptional repressor for nem operon
MTLVPRHDSKTKLLDAAVQVIRAKGYVAATVDDICLAAGVSKGSFFHHFKSKDDLGVSAADYFSINAKDLFAAAPYHQALDPLDRLLGYVDFRISLLSGEIAEYTCLLGTMVQETYASHPGLRTACDTGMSAHIAELTKDIEAAKQLYAPDAPFSAESVGFFMQSVLQGAFIFAKARQNPDMARSSLTHLRSFLELLFARPKSKPNAQRKNNRHL